MDTLLIANNRMRNLDKFLVFLSKFAFLKHLDLFGNPLAEEPDYRLKIIYAMPQIQVLDRHPVTVEERIKAKKLDPGYDKKPKLQTKKAVPVSKAFSKGEKDLFKEVKEIQLRVIQDQQEEEEKR